MYLWKRNLTSEVDLEVIVFSACSARSQQGYKLSRFGEGKKMHGLPAEKIKRQGSFLTVPKF